MNLQGSDTEIHNFELEHLSVDPANPTLGGTWFNTELNRISYNEGTPITPSIRRLLHDGDLDVLNANTYANVVNNTTNNLLLGQPVYMVSDNGNSVIVVAPANANNENHKDVIGFVTDTILANGGSGKIILFGRITGTTAQWDFITNTIGGLIPNTNYFLDIISGQLSNTIPVDSGNFCCLVGRALSATDLVIKIERPIKL